MSRHLGPNDRGYESRVEATAFSSGFDFTESMGLLCADIASRLPVMRHVDMRRVAIAFAPNRKRVLHGIQASLTPLRFAGGARVGNYRGRPHRVQSVVDQHGREALYVLTFYLPRFMDVDFREKLITVFHELWHISPEFDGDLRRHPGRCYAHTSSQSRYDRQMESHADAWLRARPPRELFDFLEMDFNTLRSHYGIVTGHRIPRPKLVPCDSDSP